jgi:hypothetical protein
MSYSITFRKRAATEYIEAVAWYKQARTKKYPYSIVYFVDEEKKRIVITTVFHNKRNPERKF